jgi:rhomboid protease GluP
MKEFAALETTALEVFNLPPSTPTNEVLKSIKEAGIKNWEKAIKLLNEVNQLDLPQDYHSRNDALKKYCDLRIKCYELLYRSVDADTHNFDKQIEDYNKQIEVIINSLVGKQK